MNFPWWNNLTYKELLSKLYGRLKCKVKPIECCVCGKDSIFPDQRITISSGLNNQWIMCSQTCFIAYMRQMTAGYRISPKTINDRNAAFHSGMQWDHTFIGTPWCVNASIECEEMPSVIKDYAEQIIKLFDPEGQIAIETYGNLQRSGGDFWFRIQTPSEPKGRISWRWR